MIFASTVFLFVFLPIFFICYWPVRGKGRNAVLLVASLVFYGYSGWQNLILLLCSILINYFTAGIIAVYNGKGRLRVLALDIIFNISMLFIFKYLNFFGMIMRTRFVPSFPVFDIALPIGISFFTFQNLSYVIDVYRGRVKAQKNILNVALYISMFPQLVAGPIVRYKTVEKEILSRNICLDDVNVGSKRFIAGMCKKVLLANNLAVMADYYFGKTDSDLSILGAWIGAICYSLQIYFDFSGYSDMAIGLGRMMGFHFDENFNYPYIAETITDFWRRWHISLSSWFRDYVYIPLGGSRCKPWRQIFNIAIVWLLTGTWHGANYTFVAWGGGYCILLIAEKYVLKPEKKNTGFRIIYRMLTIVAVVLLWTLFRAENMHKFISYFMVLFGENSSSLMFSSDIWMLSNYWIYIFIGMIASTPIVKITLEKVMIGRSIRVKSYLSAVLYMFGLVLSVSFLVLGAHNPFIYFAF